MKAFLREAFFIFCVVLAVVSGVAAATIAMAIAIGKLTDPQAWLAMAFFAAIGCAAWIAGSAARI
jgi:hypothetical protein